MKNIKNGLLEFEIIIAKIQTFLELVFEAIVNEFEWYNLWKSKDGIWLQEKING